VTAPALAITRPDGTRVYRHPVTGEEVPSVTTVIKSGFPKPALTTWAARKAAEYAVTHWAELAEMNVTDRLDLIRTAHERIAGDASAIGDAVHETIEAWAKGEAREITKGTDSYLTQFSDFMLVMQPRFIENEVTLWSRKYNYAGTADWIAEIGGHIYLGDNKTGKRVYGEAGLQLAALAGCDFILREDGTEEEFPALEFVAALHIRPRSWKLLRASHQPECFEAFVAARKTLDWTHRIEGSVFM
jgi:hypothetical protein